MDILQDHLLTVIIFSPVVAGLFIMLMPGDAKNLIRRLAFIFSLVVLGLILYAWFEYDRVDSGMQFEAFAEWFPSIGANYHIGIDGISLPMLLLTGILTPIAILASFGIEYRVNVYMALFLLMESAMIGVFISLNTVLFYIFWEEDKKN